MNEKYFTNNQVQKRLLAFAMGTSHMDETDNQVPKGYFSFVMGETRVKEWSRPMFEDKYIPMCEARFGNASGCVDFAGSDQGIILDRGPADKSRMSRCEERTTVITRFGFRPEYKEDISTEGNSKESNSKEGNSIEGNPKEGNSIEGNSKESVGASSSNIWPVRRRKTPR
jgi:hypothetical protein